MSDSRTNFVWPRDPLKWPFEDVLCELGYQARSDWLYDDAGNQEMLLPIVKPGSYRPGPYALTFYMAQDWLRRKRSDLQRAIIEKLDYGAKNDLYTRGHEEVLIRDLAELIAPLCKEPYAVDPLLAAVVLVKIGLDEFCRDYDDPNRDPKSWSLERALGIDPVAADAAARKGHSLLMAGNWKEAVPYFEEALLSYAFHFDAMNDLAYIYATYVPGHPKGIEYARRVLVNTPKSAGIDCAVLDTAGWAAYRHAHRLDRAEVHLRKALSYLTPGEQFYPTVAYHLIAVLVDAGKLGEAKRLFETFSLLPATHLFDEQSIRAARALLGWRGRLHRFFTQIPRILGQKLIK